MTKQFVSFSGGKDSTAMLHMMIDRGEQIDGVIFFDTGWEFPAMAAHIDEVEQKTGLEITRIDGAATFNYWMYERLIIARKGPMKGKVHRIGNGWPSRTRQWCTRQKIDALNKHAKRIDKAGICCVGFAVDEEWRIKKPRRGEALQRYPLIEWGITEAEALEYCQKLGYTWGGLYNLFSRVSCFCCPLQGLAELRTLRRSFPELWTRMLTMDACCPGHNKGFYHYATVHDLDSRFAFEDILCAAGVKRKFAKKWSTKWREAMVGE